MLDVVGLDGEGLGPLFDDGRSTSATHRPISDCWSGLLIVIPTVASLRRRLDDTVKAM